MPSVKSVSGRSLFTEMPTANAEPSSIGAPASAPAFPAVAVFAAAYRDPAPANSPISWASGSTAVVDARFIRELFNTEPPDTG
jgi:hypothetical protein